MAQVQPQVQPQEHPQVNQLEELIKGSRIPDTIKLIPNYEGDPKTLSSWISSVDTTLNLYATIRNTNIYNIWVAQIRNKIVGEANDALNSSHTPRNWNEIKNTLIEFFGDKRDLSTLNQKISHLCQANKSLEVYYHECTNLLTDITAKINLDPENAGHTDHILRYVRNMIKDAFIDGMNEPYSAYTRNFRPDTLVEAYHCAKEQISADTRKRQRNNSHQKPVTNVRLPMKSHYGLPPLIPRPSFSQFAFRPTFVPPTNVQRTPFNKFSPQGAIPKTFGNQQRPNSFPKPIPMDVDPSLKTRQSNFGVKPQFNQNYQRPSFNRNNGFQCNNNYQPRFTTEELTNIEQGYEYDFYQNNGSHNDIFVDRYEYLNDGYYVEEELLKNDIDVQEIDDSSGVASELSSELKGKQGIDDLNFQLGILQLPPD